MSSCDVCKDISNWFVVLIFSVLLCSYSTMLLPAVARMGEGLFQCYLNNLRKICVLWKLHSIILHRYLAIIYTLYVSVVKRTGYFRLIVCGLSHGVWGCTILMWRSIGIDSVLTDLYNLPGIGVSIGTGSPKCDQVTHPVPGGHV